MSDGISQRACLKALLSKGWEVHKAKYAGYEALRHTAGGVIESAWGIDFRKLLDSCSKKDARRTGKGG